MGGCFSKTSGELDPQDVAEINSGVKFTKQASLKLSAATDQISAGGFPSSDLADIKACLMQAKETIDGFKTEVSTSELSKARENIHKAKEMLEKAPVTNNANVSEAKNSLASVEESLKEAEVAAERNEMVMTTIDAADAASEGARKLEKVVSNTASGAKLTKVTSKVADAEAAVSSIAKYEAFGVETDAKDLSEAAAVVNSAIEGLDEEIKKSPTDVAAALGEVKKQLVTTAAKLDKRASFN